MRAVDIFFTRDYGKLSETIQAGTSELFEYRSSLGTIRHLFLKKPLIRPNGIYYELITPFRYGGPLITTCRAGKEALLVEEFSQAFGNYCRDNRIVSEFVRFHPLLANGDDFKNCYEVFHSRYTVGTSLDHLDPVHSEFSQSAKRNIRQALNAGVSYRIIRAPEDLETFKTIYFSTLHRRNAAKFNFFPPAYFSACLDLFKNQIVIVEAVYQGKVIASSFSFLWQNIIHIHLSGTLTEYLSLSPAYILRFALTNWGKQEGFSLIHHGGGLTAKKTDSLYQFKQRFGKLRFSFQVGRRVWNPQIQEEKLK